MDSKKQMSLFVISSILGLVALTTWAYYGIQEWEEEIYCICIDDPTINENFGDTWIDCQQILNDYPRHYNVTNICWKEITEFNK